MRLLFNGSRFKYQYISIYRGMGGGSVELACFMVPGCRAVPEQLRPVLSKKGRIPFDSARKLTTIHEVQGEEIMFR